MTLWLWVLLACAAVYATKLLGYLVPGSWLEHPLVGRLSTLMTVALLASLVAMNTASGDGGVVLDARVGALLAAAVALLLRAPFLVVVIAGAGAAAGLRALGIG
ncbi:MULTISPECIES: AzlD domain-containing protein [Actinomycetes]|uniref:Branched-chain amino acid transport protein (AzlD) n=2 Tax=Actinomycetes TaxID=1760 RepID=A0ABP6LSI7_9MICC|nr:AzlD domain-containing protein [Nesterenkonia sp. PF2B19]OSM42546.1 branched-chain amino acid transporter AzlD [Nesterenkonia sp. PF2B19]